MTGSGITSCTHQEPPSGNGDRWCSYAIERAGAGTELWVIDVTRFANGETIPCDGTSTGCLKLSSNLWTGFGLGGPVHPYSHEFNGDTLIYYADSSSGPSELHRGPVYAWRPGWAQPRRISSDRAVMCWGHGRLPVAFCSDDLLGDPSKPTGVVLRAGTLTDTDTMLPSIGSIRPTRTGGAVAWQGGFSPQGDYFVVSSPDPDPAVESLRVIETSQLGRQEMREIVKDASRWDFSSDGRRLYFQREDAPDERSLHVSDFPSGANATMIASKVRDYLPLGSGDRDRGLVYLTAIEGDRETFRLLRDPTKPASSAEVFTHTDILEDVHVSPDTRFTAWVDAEFKIRVVRNDDFKSCDLNVMPGNAAFEPWFLDNSGLVFWNEQADADNGRDGFFANPDGCKDKKMFARGVDFVIPIGDRAIVFGDELDDLSSTVTLKYLAVESGSGVPSTGPIRISADVDNSTVIPVGTRPMLLVFRVPLGGPSQEGTYVFGPTPF